MNSPLDKIMSHALVVEASLEYRHPGKIRSEKICGADIIPDRKLTLIHTNGEQI